MNTTVCEEVLWAHTHAKFLAYINSSFPGLLCAHKIKIDILYKMGKKEQILTNNNKKTTFAANYTLITTNVESCSVVLVCF